MTDLEPPQTITTLEHVLTQRDENEARNAALNRPAADDAPTLLKKPLARAITATTGLSSLAVRATGKAFSTGIAAGKWCTLSSIALGSTAIEAVMLGHGRDFGASRNELTQQETASIIQRGLSAIHYGATLSSVVAASGFYLAQGVVDWSSETGVRTLAMINAVLGSTESSRALASILELTHKELDKPGADGCTDIVGYTDLFLGAAAFLYLQKLGRRKTAVDFRVEGGEVSVWDIVMDDRGFRADVVAVRRTESKRHPSFSQIATSANDIADITQQIENTHHNLSLSAAEQINLSDAEIQQRIASQLPAGARARITTETTTLKTIYVEVENSDLTHVDAPAGMVMISEDISHRPQGTTQTIIFRAVSRQSDQSSVNQPQALPLSTTSLPIEEGSEPSSDSTARASVLHRPPEASSVGTNNPSSQTANQKRTRKPDVLPRRGRAQPESTAMKSTASSSKRAKSNSKGTPTNTTSAAAQFNKSVMSSSARARIPARAATPPPPVVPVNPMTPQNVRQPVFKFPTQDNTPLISPEVIQSPRESFTNYFTVHHQRRESTYSQTDSFSVHSNESSRPSSPTMSRVHLKTSGIASNNQSQANLTIRSHGTGRAGEVGSGRIHRSNSASAVPSLYSMRKKNSDEEILLAPKIVIPRNSVFEDDTTLLALARDGKVPGQFPNQHLVRTLRRFCRFSSASYGSSFLRFMGLTEADVPLSKSKEMFTNVHAEHSSFSAHTGVPHETIIKSSFLDDKGMQKGAGFSPLIHFVSIDYESKAIVLTCRGTLGFEDLLTDMACDYVDIYWQGQCYKVHEGIRNAARRLLDSAGGNHIMATLKASLEEYPEFGLVLCGHSLGGAVAAVFGILISEPNREYYAGSDRPAYIIANKPRLLPSTVTVLDTPPINLPIGRPIHVYAFGTPATVSPALRLATRGLITTVINSNDIVATLSLGTLHDFRAVARHFREDYTASITLSNIRTTVVNRMWSAAATYLWPLSHAANIHGGTTTPTSLINEESDKIQLDSSSENAYWSELCRMRSLMINAKLVPPGEVFVLESTRIFDRDADGERDGGELYRQLGRPTTRIELRYVKDVEKRFSEVRFSGAMFAEHSPGRYERALTDLYRGVCEDAL